MGGAIFTQTGGTITISTSLLKGNLAPQGASLHLQAGTTISYVLPAPPGHWVPATTCEVWREACPQGDDDCKDAAASCAMNHTANVDNCQQASGSASGNEGSGCMPATFNQPCSWQAAPLRAPSATVYTCHQPPEPPEPPPQAREHQPQLH